MLPGYGSAFSRKRLELGILCTDLSSRVSSSWTRLSRSSTFVALRFCREGTSSRGGSPSTDSCPSPGMLRFESAYFSSFNSFSRYATRSSALKETKARNTTLTPIIETVSINPNRVVLPKAEPRQLSLGWLAGIISLLLLIS